MQFMTNNLYFILIVITRERERERERGITFVPTLRFKALELKLYLYTAPTQNLIFSYSYVRQMAVIAE